MAGLTLDAGALIACERGAPEIPKDACVAFGVRERGDALATSDPDDMRRLLGSGSRILVV